MSLREAAIKVKTERPPELCKIGRIHARLPLEDQEWLTAALADQEEWPSLALSELLASEGHPVSDPVIRKHRIGACRCAR